MLVDKLIKYLFMFVTGVIAFGIIALILFLVLQGVDDISWTFITKFPENSMTSGGIFPALVGSLNFLVVAMIFAIPVGILGAIYLSEYSKDNLFKRIVLTSVNILAGIPSVIFGLFGLALFCIMFGFGTSVIAGGLTLGIMSLPYIISNTHESLRSVPDSYRKASYGLGANKAQTAFGVVVPSATSRIITGIIIAVGRIIGETAPILFTGAAFYITKNPSNLFQPTMALPTHIFVLSTVYSEEVTPKLEGTISVLILIVVVLFLIASIFRKKSEKFQGG
ncbi:MAG: phosphate ABC transporter permease PstA [Kosmotoga sp.]|jgi:phosphate transport system permease protein|nr:MAG: phosphate ABC transporter permease PstA [Kosmotoga sp.]